jgi:hypothetical protein
MRDLIKFIREEFYAEIAVKTGWGKEELKLVFERAITNGTIRAAEAKGEHP